MRSVTVKAPAKINLVLDVVGRRDDGYHDLKTVFQTVSWYDRVTVNLTDGADITLSCNEAVPLDERNTAYKAAALFLAHANMTCGVRIHIEKHIPMQAGLAGGSADAAGVLAALDVLTDHAVSRAGLLELAAKIGADVPFCLEGGTALGLGTGTQLLPLKAVTDGTFVIVKPPCGVSTPEAYRLVDTADAVEHPSVDDFCRALDADDWRGMTAAVGNSFEAALALPDCLAIRNRLLQSGADAACMSGSGSAVFGWFADKADALFAAKSFGEPMTVYVCEPCGGVVIE